MVIILNNSNLNTWLSFAIAAHLFHSWYLTLWTIWAAPFLSLLEPTDPLLASLVCVLAPLLQNLMINCSSFKSFSKCESESWSFMSDSATLWTVACSWNSPGRNTGMSSHSLLQDTFQIQGLKPGPLHCSQTLYHLSQQGSVRKIHIYFGEGYKCYFCFFCFPYYWNLAKQTNKQTNNPHFIQNAEWLAKFFFDTLFYGKV